jgi:hypothetical protein
MVQHRILERRKRLLNGKFGKKQNLENCIAKKSLKVKSSVDSWFAGEQRRVNNPRIRSS